MANNLARLVTRLQVETSKYVADVNQTKRGVTKFARGIDQPFKNVETILNPAALRELDQKLAGLAASATGPILRRAVNRAIRPALEEAKNTVPIGKVPHKTYKGRLVAPGFARKSLKIKTLVSRDKQAAAALLGVAGEAYYALQFIELGTSEIPATPWLQPAFEGTATKQQDAIAAELKAGIERAARK